MALGIPTHKVILCGEYGVGKSSIFRRFLDNSFTEDTGPRSTIGLDHFGKKFHVQGRHPIQVQYDEHYSLCLIATMWHSCIFRSWCCGIQQELNALPRCLQATTKVLVQQYSATASKVVNPSTCYRSTCSTPPCICRRVRSSSAGTSAMWTAPTPSQPLMCLTSAINVTQSWPRHLRSRAKRVRGSAPCFRPSLRFSTKMLKRDLMLAESSHIAISFKISHRLRRVSAVVGDCSSLSSALFVYAFLDDFMAGTNVGYPLINHSRWL